MQMSERMTNSEARHACPNNLAESQNLDKMKRQIRTRSKRQMKNAPCADNAEPTSFPFGYAEFSAVLGLPSCLLSVRPCRDLSSSLLWTQCGMRNLVACQKKQVIHKLGVEEQLGATPAQGNYHATA
eukprot:2411241-Amphidinium_carterae.1